MPLLISLLQVIHAAQITTVGGSVPCARERGRGGEGRGEGRGEGPDYRRKQLKYIFNYKGRVS